jgi:two-component system response regulator YesN
MKMNSLLLVDDEKIERESLARLINWEDEGIDFIGTAANGKEACEIISRSHPDIVITDIKMPLMSGIELIRCVAQEGGDTVFVVLSGYGDYEFTSKAMLYGVKYYLLKPVMLEDIRDVLKNVRADIAQRENSRREKNILEGNLERVLPQVREQFFKVSCLSQVYNEKDSVYFKSLFGITEDVFSVLLLRPYLGGDFADKYALRNMAEDVLGRGNIVMSTILDDCVAILKKHTDFAQTEKCVDRIREAYLKYFGTDICAALSGEEGFENIHRMYGEAGRLLGYRTELPGRSVLRTQDIAESMNKINLAAFITDLGEMVRGGRIDELSYRIALLFSKMKEQRLTPGEVKTCSRMIAQSVLTGGAKTDSERVCEEIAAAGDADAVCAVLKKALGDEALANYDAVSAPQNQTVDTMIKYVYRNISDPQLKLYSIADNVLYMNERYISRLFFKETGEKFSHFVMKTRIEIAKKLIENGGDISVTDISQMTGFGDNTQYFSRVFKAFTGLTPSEYRSGAGKTDA